MPRLKESVIKEIAKEIGKGNTCYLLRNTAEVTVIDDSIEDQKMLAKQEKKLAEIERKIERYVKVEQLSAEDQHIIRKDFLEEAPNKSVRKELSNALNRKNPVRNFNQILESDVELHQNWINFNIKEYRRWVSNFILDAYHYAKK